MGLFANRQLVFASYALLALTAQNCLGDTLVPPPNMVPPRMAESPARASYVVPLPAASPVASSTDSYALDRARSFKDPAIGRLDSLSDDDWSAQPAQVLFSTSSGIVMPNGVPRILPVMQQPELVQEFGCTHILSKTFQRTQRSVTILVYTFPDERGAFGAYSTMRTGASTVLVRGDASSEDENSISFWRGSRFVVLASTADEDETSKRLISRLADELSQTIDTSLPKPPLVVNLPTLDRIAGSERFFMGPVGTRKHISIPFMRTLSIESSAGVGFAEYRFSKPLAERMKALLIDYKDPTLARQVYTLYTAALAGSHKSQLTQPNMQMSKIADSYMLCGINNSRVTIIAGARRKVSPLVLARQFAY